jgi:hypothetical protein
MFRRTRIKRFAITGRLHGCGIKGLERLPFISCSRNSNAKVEAGGKPEEA